MAGRISSIIDQLPDQLKTKFQTFIYDYWIYLFRKCGIIGFRNTNIKSTSDVAFLNQMSRLFCFNFGCVCIAVAEKSSKENIFIFGKRWSQEALLKWGICEEKLDSDLNIKLTFEVNFEQIKSKSMIDCIDINIRPKAFKKLTSNVYIINKKSSYVSFDINEFIGYEEDVIAMSRSYLLLSVDHNERKLIMQPNCLFWQVHPHKEEFKDWNYSNTFIQNSWNCILSHINSIKELRRKFSHEFNSQIQKNTASQVNQWFAELKNTYHLNIWCILQDPKQLLLQNILNIEMQNQYSNATWTLVTLYFHYCYLSWHIFQLAIHQSMCNFYPLMDSEFRKEQIEDQLAKLKFAIFCYSLIYRYSQTFFYSCCDGIYIRLTLAKGSEAFLDKSFQQSTLLSPMEYIKRPRIAKALQHFITDSLVNLADATNTFYHIVNNGTGMQLSTKLGKSTLRFYKNEGYHTEVSLIRYVSQKKLKLTKIGCSHLSCPQCYVALDAYRTEKSPDLNPVSAHAYLYNWKMSGTQLRDWKQLLFGKFALKVLDDKTEVDITLSKPAAGRKRKSMTYKKFYEVCRLVIEQMPSVVDYIEKNTSIILKIPRSLSNKWLDVKGNGNNSTKSKFVYIRTVKSDNDMNTVAPLSPTSDLESADITINYDVLSPESVCSDYSEDQVLEIDDEEISADIQQNGEDDLDGKKEAEEEYDTDTPISNIILYPGYRFKQPKLYCRSTIVCDINKSLYMFIYHFIKYLVDQKFSEIESLNIDEVTGLLSKMQLKD